MYGPQSREVLRESFLYHHKAVSNQEIYDLIRHHYALEVSVVATIQESMEEKRPRGILEKTTIRVGDRFDIGLLWKTDINGIP